MHSFFFCDHSCNFNSQFLYELKQFAILIRNVSGIFHFRFRFIFFKVFCSAKSIDSWTLKRHNSFQNKSNRKGTDSFASRTLILNCNKKFRNSMIFAWDGAPQKTVLETKFLTYKIEVLSTSRFLKRNS